MTLYTTTFPIPTGEFSLAVDSAGAVVATAFGDLSHLKKRTDHCVFVEDAKKTAKARKQIEEYFAGKRREFDLTLAPSGTAFQTSVWKALQKIPFGKTNSYGQLAAKLKRPGAARAVGRANATNPICLIVPCHRVIGADGSLTGFAFGEDIKRQLLEHEGVLQAEAWNAISVLA